MKSIKTLLTALSLTLALSASAAAQDVLVACKLDDPKSVSFCKTDPRMAIACQRAYRLNESTRQAIEVNPGRLLPPIFVEQWSETEIFLKRDIETTNPKVREVLHTRFDRVNGRLLEYSNYIWLASESGLTKKELNSFEADQVNRIGIFGYLNRDTVTAECKIAKAAF